MQNPQEEDFLLSKLKVSFSRCLETIIAIYLGSVYRRSKPV